MRHRARPPASPPSPPVEPECWVGALVQHPVHGAGRVQQDLGHLLLVGFPRATHLVARVDLTILSTSAPEPPPAVEEPAGEPVQSMAIPDCLVRLLESNGFTCRPQRDHLLVSVAAGHHRIVARLSGTEHGFAIHVLAGHGPVPSGSSRSFTARHPEDGVMTARQIRHHLDRLLRPPPEHRPVGGIQIVNGGLPGLGKRR